MIYHLALQLRDSVHWLNVVHYVSFRVIAALLTALAFAFICGHWFIERSRLFFRAKAREHTPANHRAKDNMPTMGGLFILATVFFTTLLWCNLTDPHVWVMLACLAAFGLIGFWDDWSKMKYHKGITERAKFKAQVVAATTISLAWYFFCHPSTTLCVPFFKDFNPDLGLFLIPLAIFIMIGTSNAVNLTDGLDGLAIGSLLSNFATFSILAYIAGHAVFAHYLHVPFAATSEIAIIGVTLFGASLGFLWYNAYPAQIFMGDVGSLALGAGLACMALMVRQELLLAIAGGLFVAETVSVMLQVTSYKYLGKRIFRMAPIHHHFELLGWPETKITVRFAIISLILSLIALMTLKLR
jgi:phospho-N-acetylmuramoyl-pentapeptide-transferase